MYRGLATAVGVHYVAVPQWAGHSDEWVDVDVPAMVTALEELMTKHEEVPVEAGLLAEMEEEHHQAEHHKDTTG